MKKNQPNLFAACPLDAPVTNGYEAEHPRKAAPNFAVFEIDFAAAKAMVEEFHYSKNLPNVVRRNFMIAEAAWLPPEAVACYGPIVSCKAPKEWMELRRLVKRPGSQIILSEFLAATLRILKAEGVPAVMSWADPEQDHHGGIYQATNWVYTGQKAGGNWTFVTETGQHIHPRTVYARFGTQSVPAVLALNPGWSAFLSKTKHRYLMPLNIRKNKALAMLKTCELPYPKPARGMNDTL